MKNHMREIDSLKRSVFFVGSEQCSSKGSIPTGVYLRFKIVRPLTRHRKQEFVTVKFFSLSSRDRENTSSWILSRYATSVRLRTIIYTSWFVWCYWCSYYCRTPYGSGNLIIIGKIEVRVKVGVRFRSRVSLIGYIYTPTSMRRTKNWMERTI